MSSAHSDYSIPLPEMCPKCGNMNLLQKGFGTEKIQEVLKELLPEKQIGRFDRDEIKNITQLEKTLDDFECGEIDVLVGTQMLSKGHNFKRVNLVVVLGVDSQMNFPDFRAIEKTYQLLTQITGRSGRFSKEANVIVQSLSPESHIFSYIKDHSFEDFYLEELKLREMTKLPPYTKIAMIHFHSRFREKVLEESCEAKDYLVKVNSFNKLEVEVLGPVPAMIEKKVGQYTWSIMLKSVEIKHLHLVMENFSRKFNIGSGVKFRIDIDPYFCF